MKCIVCKKVGDSDKFTIEKVFDYNGMLEVFFDVASAVDGYFTLELDKNNYILAVNNDKVDTIKEDDVTDMIMKYKTKKEMYDYGTI